jgi:dihydropteridine reductase
LLDVIVCASGGWQPDPPAPSFSATASAHDFEEAARVYAQTVHNMMRMNLDPVVAASFCAQHYMAPDGLFVVMGATAALAATPGMLGYGLSKAAAHHLVHTLGASTGKSVEAKSVRKAGQRVRKNLVGLDTLSVIGILPTTIDTPSNRRATPDGNFDQWTKPLDIAKEIGMWVEKPPLRPHSGSLVKVHPKREGPGALFELVR